MLSLKPNDIRVLIVTLLLGILVILLCESAKAQTNLKPITKPDSIFSEWNLTQPLSINVLANDKDPNGDRIVITSYKIGATSYKPNDTVMRKGMGQFILKRDGQLIFNPLQNLVDTINLVYTCNDATQAGVVKTGAGKTGKVFIGIYRVDWISDCDKAWTTVNGQRGYYVARNGLYYIQLPSSYIMVSKQEYDTAMANR